MKKAEVTAFLSLIFILLLTMTGALMESASIQMAKNYRRADMNRAVESVFAEYQKELLENYDIFALEASYESGEYSEDLIKNRLVYFGAGNMEQEIQKIEFLTDNGAKAFYEQISYYMEHKYGIDFLKDKISMTELWKKQEKDSEEYGKEENEGWDKLKGFLKDENIELSENNNPIDHVENLKQTPFLTLITPNEMSVSGKSLNLDESLVKREKNQGYGDFSDEQKDEGTLSKLMVSEYLLSHFSAATDKKSEKAGALDYELEYICAGKESDRENLEAVGKKILMMRFGINYVFLKSSASKCAEAEALALTLCSVVALPALTEAAKQVILLAWAYGESIVDLRTLLKGQKVAAIKTEESWQLSLSGLLKLNENGDINDGKDCKDGISYREYLRILLFLEKKDQIAMRALDIIEQNLKKIYGLDFFRADFCVSKIKIKSKCNLRRGVSYQFLTYYGYQ
ncbi:MAG: DUF5702 domain-containing protein [Lachnospiraceae bacterium]